MAYDSINCPKCGEQVKLYRNPFPTVDIILEVEGGIVLIERKNEPIGWALPGGFVDYGETLEAAAVREAMEETSLKAENLELLGCYSDPGRDPRQHNISAVYIAKGNGIPAAADDAAALAVFSLDSIPEKLCFDHRRVIDDYLRYRRTK